MNNRGFSLQISYVVTIIIMILIIAFGFVFVGKGIENANTGAEFLDQAHRNKIMAELQTGTKTVSIPYAQATIAAGETHSFGVGVRNNLGQRATFDITLVFDRFNDPQGQEMTNTVVETVEAWYPHQRFTLSLDDRTANIVPFSILTKGAIEGSYIFDLLVRCDLDPSVCEPYAHRKITILAE